MTYIDYINLFWKTSQSVKFSSNEAYLYFYLLSECNNRGWENPFECPNRRIILSIGISEPTLIDCRNRLQNKGMLIFEPGKRNEKSPIYYLNDLSKGFSKTFSKRFSKDLSKRFSKDPSIINKTKIKTKNNIIPPTPPKGDEERERLLEEKEKALKALEAELLKREAEQSAKPRKPPKPRKEASSLNSEARKLFEAHYHELSGASYYWSAKDAGNMTALLGKLRFQREKKSMSVDDDGLLEALDYLLGSITDAWILENYSVTNINSKFNELVAQITTAKKRHDGKDTRDAGGARARERETDEAIKRYAIDAFGEDVFGD